MALTKSQQEHMAALDSRYGFPGGTMQAVANIESSGNGNAKSPANATGYFQLTPPALKDAGINRDDARNLSFERQADIAANHLNKGFERFGDIGTALAGYNAGNGRVNQVMNGRASIPRETADYVRKFMDAGIIGDDSPVTQYATSAKRGGLKAPDTSDIGSISDSIGSGVDWDTLLSGKSHNGSSGVDWDAVLSSPATQQQEQQGEQQPFKANIPYTAEPTLGYIAEQAGRGLNSCAEYRYTFASPCFPPGNGLTVSIK